MYLKDVLESFKYIEVWVYKEDSDLKMVEYKLSFPSLLTIFLKVSKHRKQQF